MALQLLCSECEIPFDGSRKIWADLAFCKTCRKKHSKDILEIVNENTFTIYKDSEIEEAEASLKNLEADIRLDLHKTLDTINSDIMLPRSTCCISYVGRLTSTRINARQEIQERIRSGQLLFGALVFARGSRKTPVESNKFKEPGSKAWFNQLIKGTDPLFIDDSDDHVLSVESIGVRSLQLYSGENLLSLINKPIYDTSEGSEDVLFG